MATPIEQDEFIANATDDPIRTMNKLRGYTDTGEDDNSDAKPVAAPTPKAKPRIVGKKELEDSGLSLRDFLNKERGLKRRAEPAAKSAPEPAAKPRTKGALEFGPEITYPRQVRSPYSYAKGGSVGSASKRADGIAQRGKTRA